MLLQPKRWKFRKQMTPFVKGVSKGGNSVAFGDFGIKSIENGFVSNRELEAVRKVIIRRIRKIGKIRIRVFPDTPITKGGLEMPMGKGKGDVDKFVARIRRGKVLFEMGGIPESLAKECFDKALYKMSLKVRFVKKGEIK